MADKNNVMAQNILIVDDLADVRMSAAIVLINHGFEVQEAASPLAAMAVLEQQPVDLVLLDMNFSQDTTSGEEGLAFLRELANKGIGLPVVVMTAWASVELAVTAMQLGAVDFIEKPWANQRLINIIRGQLNAAALTSENKRLKAGLRAGQASVQEKAVSGADCDMLGQSPAMVGLLEKARRAALADAPILITGENGTGKSLLAEYIHQHSPRRDEALISVNMGAIPESLFESELFGHKKGAFTDAKEDRLGRFEVARGGSLFLDEVGNTPLNQQSKLLRVLESHEFEAVGSSRTQVADVRVIAATNAELSEAIAEGQFRRDLYFRLNTLELHIPPLRERPEDIEPLAEHLLDRHRRKYQRPQLGLSNRALKAMKSYHWPGNVRELSHVLERAVILSGSDHIDVGDLMLSQGQSDTVTTPNPDNFPLVTLEEAEALAIKKALTVYQGQVLEAADYLGLSKSAIYRRLDKYQIDYKG